jgi:hypothetical protein
MRNLSKSKLLAFRQCPKRLWLELHRPDLQANTTDTEARFQVCHEVGEIARRLYDPNGTGTLVNVQAEGFGPAPARPTSAMSKTGMISSPLSGEGGGTASAGAIARASDPASPTPAVAGATAVAAALVSTGGCLSRGKPETNAAPHAAVSARNGMAIQPIDMGVMAGDQWPNRWLVSTSLKSMVRRIGPGNQVRAPGSMQPAKQPRESLAILAAMRWASSQILPVLSSFPSLFRLQKWTELNHPSAGGRRGSGGLAMHGVMRVLIARWAALIAMLGLLALVIATSRIPCVPYGLWPTLQMHCR